MNRFFEIGRGLARPKSQSFRRADKPIHAAFAPQLSTVTTPAAPAIIQKQPDTMEPIMTAPAPAPAPAPAGRTFPQIRIGDAAPVESSVIERHALGFGDATVRGLAARCAAALERLVRENAFASFASRAIEGAQTDGGTPADWLARTLSALEEETALAKTERNQHDARVKARSDRLQPLKSAVSARHDSADREILVLAERVRFAEKHPFGNQAENQYQKLIDAGLKPKQIELVGVENPVSKILEEAERHKARIAILRAELPALWAFVKCPRSDPAHLAGLAGFDALIAAMQNVVEEKAP